jgi:hypothetical protein
MSVWKLNSAKRKQREEEECLTPEQRERERLEAERREREEKERLEAERCARDNLEAQQSERGRLEQEISQPQEKELLVHSKLTPLVTIVIFRIASVGCILGGIFLALIFIPHIGDRDAFAPVAVTVAIASLLGFWGIYIWKSILKK